MSRYQRISDTPDKSDERGNRLCRNCDSLVSEGRRHYCSTACMETFNRDHTWHFVRKDVLRRDKYRCGICERRFRKSQLEVDHIIPVRMGWDCFDKANLRTLCKECHKAKSRLDREALSEA